MYNFNNGDKGLRPFVDFFIKYLQQEVNIYRKQLLDSGADIFKSEFSANKNVLVVVDISSQYCDIYYNFITCKDKSFINYLVIQLSHINS